MCFHLLTGRAAVWDTKNKSVAGTWGLCHSIHRAVSGNTGLIAIGTLLCRLDTMKESKSFISMDAGNRFSFNNMLGHLGWSGLLRPTFFSLSEAWISLHTFSWHFSFVRRFASYSFSSAMDCIEGNWHSCLVWLAKRFIGLPNTISPKNGSLMFVKFVYQVFVSSARSHGSCTL